MTKNLTKNLATPTRIALTLVLALALILAFSAPALAAEGESAGDSGNFSAGSANTTVNMKFSTDTTQISATVPVSVTLAVRNDKTIVAPTNYEITSICLVPIHVSTISVTPKTGYTLVTDTLDSDGDMKLTLTAGTDVINLSASTPVTPSPQTIGKKSAWTIAANGTLNLVFAGSVYNIPADWVDGAEVFTVTYTLAIGSAS